MSVCNHLEIWKYIFKHKLNHETSDVSSREKLGSGDKYVAGFIWGIKDKFGGHLWLSNPKTMPHSVIR